MWVAKGEGVDGFESVGWRFKQGVRAGKEIKAREGAVRSRQIQMRSGFPGGCANGVGSSSQGVVASR